MNTTKFFLVCFFFYGFVQEGFSQQSVNSADTLTAVSILARSEQSYNKLDLYLDSGRVINDFYGNAHPHKEALYFKTAYSGKEGFNFEYYQPGKSNSLFTINRTGGKVQSWWGVTNQLTTGKTLSSALGAAGGVSSRTSTIVPQLLMPEDFPIKKSMLFHSFSPVLNGSELVKGIDCYRIKGLSEAQGKITIWIAKHDFLIRKIETDKTINSKSTRAKADLVMGSKFKLDSISLKKRSDAETSVQKKTLLLNELDSLEKVRARNKKLMNMADEIARPGRFSVRTTYEYYPYTLKVLNKKVFAFRPNREVEL